MDADRKRLRVVYDGMKSRCYYKKHQSYKYYGGKGITLCEEWFNSFDTFYDWAIREGYKKGLSIERVDGNDNYCPENCEWIESRLQAKNQSSNRKLEIGGVTKNVSDWARDSGIHRTTINSRIKRGLTGVDLIAKVVNHKPKVAYYEYQGKLMTMKEIADINGHTKGGIRRHMKKGLSLSESLELIGRNKKCKEVNQ